MFSATEVALVVTISLSFIIIMFSGQLFLFESVAGLKLGLNKCYRESWAEYYERSRPDSVDSEFPKVTYTIIFAMHRSFWFGVTIGRTFRHSA